MPQVEWELVSPQPCFGVLRKRLFGSANLADGRQNMVASVKVTIP